MSKLCSIFIRAWISAVRNLHRKIVVLVTERYFERQTESKCYSFHHQFNWPTFDVGKYEWLNAMPFEGNFGQMFVIKFEKKTLK